MDLFSLHRLIHEVIAYLDTVYPRAASRARRRYSCFDHLFADDGQAYGFTAAFGAGPSCERLAIEQLVELQRNALTCARRDGLLAEMRRLAQQNARTVAASLRHRGDLPAGDRVPEPLFSHPAR